VQVLVARSVSRFLVGGEVIAGHISSEVEINGISLVVCFWENESHDLVQSHLKFSSVLFEERQEHVLVIFESVERE